jgi:hypothetical protein
MGGRAGKIFVADAMALVLAVAIGFGWTRARQRAHWEWLSTVDPILAPAMPRSTFEKSWEWLKGYLPCVATMMPALMILSWRQPRAVDTRPTSRPGVLACYTASLVLGLEAARAGILTVREIVRHGWVVEAYGYHYRFVWWETVVPIISPADVGLALTSAWLVLVLSGNWRPNPDWIDRAGRGFGVLWVVLGIVDTIEPWRFLEDAAFIPIR